MPVRVQVIGAARRHHRGRGAQLRAHRGGRRICWGSNVYGQLGNGGDADSAVPVRVAGDHAFTSLHAFGSHTCGVTASSETFCWGYNLDGQLGDGTRSHRSRPVYVQRPGTQ